MHKILAENIEKIRTLCAKHKVKSLYAFGSITGDDFNDSSDVDFLISFFPTDPVDYADRFFSIADKLEKLLRRPVDLLTDKSLSNPYFIESVNETKTLLYGKEN